MPSLRLSSFALVLALVFLAASVTATPSIDFAPRSGEALLPALHARGSVTDDGPIAGYYPKKWAAGLSGALFGLACLLQWTWLTMRGRRYMLTLTIGMTCMTTGLFLRIPYSYFPNSLGLYIVMYMFVLLSPCAFLANQYILLKHLSASFDPAVSTACLIIPAPRLVKLFVLSDVTTFFIQAAGGALSTSHGANIDTVSKIILLIGLVLQLFSFALYTITLIIFGARIYKRYPGVWSGEPDSSRNPPSDGKHWTTIYKVILVACVGCLVRSVFRVAESVGGFNGYLATHEVYLYCLDTLPLFLAMGLYVFFWPPRYFSQPKSELFIPEHKMSTEAEQLHSNITQNTTEIHPGRFTGA